MATRYGGKYSPDNARPTSAVVETRANTTPDRMTPNSLSYRFRRRLRILSFASIPLVVSGLGALIGGDVTSAIASFVALAGFLSATVMVREGLRAEDVYNSRKIARPPAFPRKLIGALLFGAASFVGSAFAWKLGMGQSVAMGVVATVMSGLAFGLDPMKKKGLEGFDEFENDRVARAIDKGEGYLAEMTAIANRVNDREIKSRVNQFAQSARDMFRSIEDDPRELANAKKYLSVYLMGARDATAKFANVYEKDNDVKAAEDYQALLNDLEANFRAKRKEILQDNQQALNIEIEVLRDRLKYEGIAIKEEV